MFMNQKMRSFVTLALLTAFLILGNGQLVAADRTSGTCGKQLTWNYKEGVLRIRGKGRMKNYDGFNKELELKPGPWRKLKIRKIVVEEGVTSIGDQAFYGFTALRRVKLPGSLVTIGKNSFEGCDHLTSIRLPRNLRRIGLRASGASPPDHLHRPICRSVPTFSRDIITRVPVLS